MRPGEVDQRLSEPGIGQGARCAEPDEPACRGRLVAYHLAQAVDLADQLDRALAVDLAGSREGQLAGGAVEQKSAELVLEIPHVF